MAEDEGPDRTDDDAEAVDADRGGDRGKAGQLEKDAAPDRRRNHAGDQEVVLLDHRADDAGERDLIDLVGGRCGNRSCGYVAHHLPPSKLSVDPGAGATTPPIVYYR